MLAQERAHAQALAEQSDSVLAAGRAATGFSARVQEAVLALVRTTDPAECVVTELPALLGIDAITLCLQDMLPSGTVARLLGQREAVYREAPTDTLLLHGAAASLARVDALVRLTSGALLALASRDRARLHAGQGVPSLVFLGQAVSAALER
jgi:tRNA G37 N-methylase TrmD